MARTLIETRRRGFFGWVFLVLFWGWNMLMAAALFIGMSENASTYQRLTSEAERTGHNLGTGLGMMMILSVWASGALIIGLAVLLTRGKRVLTEVDGR